MCCEVYSRLIYSLPNSRIMSLHNSTLVQMEKRCLLFSDYLCSLLPFKAMKRWFFFDQRLILICVASQIAFIGIRYRAHLFVLRSAKSRQWPNRAVIDFAPLSHIRSQTIMQFFALIVLKKKKRESWSENHIPCTLVAMEYDFPELDLSSCIYNTDSICILFGIKNILWKVFWSSIY